MTPERTQRFDGPLVTWAELPEVTRLAVERHTGAVTGARTLYGGFNSQFVAVVDTPGGEVFAKGMQTSSPRAWMQANEALANPYLEAIAPRLLWQAEAGGWHVLGFEHVTGRPADYSPGSPDVANVAATIALVAALECPPVALQAAEDRWRDYCDQPHLMAGDALVHADWNPGNVLVDGDTVWVVDWAWPVRGAACIDPASWVMWLVIAGHSPAEAEDRARRIPGYADSAAGPIDAYVQALRRRCAEIARNRPAAWERQMAVASAGWGDHRGVR